MEPIKNVNVCIIYLSWLVNALDPGCRPEAKLTLYLSEIGTIQQAAVTQIKY